MIITGYDGSNVVARALKACLAGERVPSRVGPTREVLDASLLLAAPCRMLAVGVNRSDLRPALAVAEGLHLIAGTPHGALVKAITADIDSTRWDSADPIGVTLRDQVPPILSELGHNPDSRRGYATLWNAGDLHTRADQACAVGLHFMGRPSGRLRLRVIMRSNDAWHGLPYNLFAFGMLQSTVAYALDLIPGEYRQDVSSLHLYERHVDRACAVRLKLKPSDRGWGDYHYSPFVGGVGEPADGRDARTVWSEARYRAEYLLAGHRPDGPVSESEEWCYRRIYEAIG